MQLRVWWNINGNNKYYKVNTVEEAQTLIQQLTDADLTDDSVEWNAGGLEVFEDDEWSEYYNEEGLDIMEIMEGE